MAKKKDSKPKPAPEPEPAPQPVAEEEEVTCPVCGKPVGLEVTSCPHCGAEFEEEEVAEIEDFETPAPASQPAKAAAPAQQSEDDEDTAECPVCGKSVSLSVSSCPYCGAEFEEEEVEEVIEVEEKQVATPRPPPVEYTIEEEAMVVEEVFEEEEPVDEVEVADEEELPSEAPSSILDLRVIGVSLVILGILGSQISFLIDWYWTWVPPIQDNLGLFVAIPAIVIVAGLLIFMLFKRGSGAKKRAHSMMPGISLSIFLFGIFALVLIMLWDPINSTLRNQSAGVGGAFLAVLIIGVLAMFMGQKMTSRSSA